MNAQGKEEKMKRVSCEARIKKKFRGRIKDFKRILKAHDPIEELNSYSLCLSEKKIYRLELSWGGPQDYLDFEYDPQAKQLSAIVYYFLDWFDGAKLNVNYGSEEWKVLEELFYSCLLIE